MSIRVASSSGFAVVSSLLIFNIVPLAFASDPQWVEVRSPHFSVVTDAGEKRGRETALKFEQMRAVFGALLTRAKVNLPVPLQIVAFRNTKEFRQFAPLWQGKPTQLAGLFQAGPDRSFILLDMSVEDPWTVVLHEYAHQLLSGNITGETQPWFDEGFAEYFSTIEVDGKQAKLGKKPPPGDWEVLHQYGMMKVSDLFRVQHDSREYNEGDRRSVFYAESWLLVHYLYDTNQVAKVSPFFNAVMDRKVSIEDGIQQAFGMSAAQFDKTLREYMARGQVRYMSIPTPPGIEMTGYTVASIGMAVAKTVMADAHLHSMDYQDKAANEFEEVLTIEPNNGAALRGLGYASDSYALLAYTQMSSGEHDEALESMKKALQLSPRNEQYLYNLSQIYLAVQRVDEAVNVIRSLENSRDPGIAASARNSMEQVAKMKIVLEAMSKRPEGGRVEGPSPDHEAAAKPNDTAADNQYKPLPRDPHPLRFLKGKLMNVDCSAAPAAVLTVISDRKTWKMRVADSKHIIVIGADNFSCGWTNQRVALNYRETADGEGNVATVEIQ